MIVQSITNALASDQPQPDSQQPASGDAVALSLFAGALQTPQTLPAVDAVPGPGGNIRLCYQDQCPEVVTTFAASN